MEQILFLLLLNSLFINGLFIAFSEGHILSKIKNRFQGYLPYYINKPLWSCVACMASIWGVLFFCITYEWHFLKWYFLVIYIPSLSFLNAFLFLVKETISTKIEANEAVALTAYINSKKQ